MPLKDPQKRAEYERKRQRRKRAEAAAGARTNFPVPSDLAPDPLPENLRIGDLTKIIAQEIDRVRAADVDAIARARTIGYLSGVLLKVLEISNLEQRITALEETMKQQSEAEENGIDGGAQYRERADEDGE